MKNVLKGLGWMSVWSASTAYAAHGSGGDAVGWLGYLFTGFFSVVIATQLVPAAILFVAMLRGVFMTVKGTSTAVHGR